MPRLSATPSNPGLSHPKYRPDIDGLRAIAVLSVVGFHAFPNWIPGGFIGVDVFFVISGFLITTILFKSLEAGTFSFSDFYSRRIKRIFPALFVVLVACYALGWVTLLPDEFKLLGKHIAAGAGFIANWAFWSEAGYFDTASDLKPLLHLWSLGIEEQFYIVWPLLLWLAWKRNINLLTLTVVLALASFLWNVGSVHEHPVAAFYSPQTRFWELMCGSVLAWFSVYGAPACQPAVLKLDRCLSRVLYRETVPSDGRTLANVMAWTGLLLLVFGFWRLSKDAVFPGAWALVPVVAAIIVIAAGPHAWPNRTLLSNKVAVWFGLISFPLYLWHWPLLSFARIIDSGIPSRGVRIGAVVLSIGLAWLTYRVIERPIRFGKARSVFNVYVLVALMAAVGYAGYNAYQRHGLPFRSVVKMNSHADSGNDGGSQGHLVNRCIVRDDSMASKYEYCVEDGRGTIRFALMGDSKSASLHTGLVRTSSDQGRWLFIGGNGAHGAPVPYLDTPDDPARPLTVAAVNAIAHDPRIETVVLVTAIRALFGLSDGVKSGNVATYNHTYLKDLHTTRNADAAYLGLNRVVERFVAAGKKVVLVVDNPALPNPQDCLNRTTAWPLLNRLLGGSRQDCSLPLSEFNDDIQVYRALLAKVQKAHPEAVTIFDPTDMYCADDTCSAIKNGRLMYSYTDHISDYAAGLVGQRLNDMLTKH